MILSKNTEPPEPADKLAGNSAGSNKSPCNTLGRNICSWKLYHKKKSATLVYLQNFDLYFQMTGFNYKSRQYWRFSDRFTPAPIIVLVGHKLNRHLSKALFTLDYQHGYVQDMKIYPTGKSLILNSSRGVLVEWINCVSENGE